MTRLEEIKKQLKDSGLIYESLIDELSARIRHNEKIRDLKKNVLDIYKKNLKK